MTGVSRALYEPDVLRLANRSTGYVLVKADAAGTVVFTNEAADDMLGYFPGELEGKTVDALVPDDRRAGHAELRELFLANPSVRPMGWGRKLEARRKDGTTFPVFVSLAPGYSGGTLHVLAKITRLQVEEPVVMHAPGKVG